MRVIVEGKEMHITQALQEHAQKQARKISKVSQQSIRVRLYLETVKKKSNDPKANKVTYTVELPGNDVVVSAHAIDMYEAITKATDIAVRRVRKEQEKMRTLERET